MAIRSDSRVAGRRCSLSRVSLLFPLHSSDARLSSREEIQVSMDTISRSICCGNRRLRQMPDLFFLCLRSRLRLSLAPSLSPSLAHPRRPAARVAMTMEAEREDARRETERERGSKGSTVAAAAAAADVLLNSVASTPLMEEENRYSTAAGVVVATTAAAAAAVFVVGTTETENRVTLSLCSSLSLSLFS